MQNFTPGLKLSALFYSEAALGKSFTTVWANSKMYAESFITTRMMFGFIKWLHSGSRSLKIVSSSAGLERLEMNSAQRSSRRAR